MFIDVARNSREKFVSQHDRAAALPTAANIDDAIERLHRRLIME
jgi:hypothetical protein